MANLLPVFLAMLDDLDCVEDNDTDEDDIVPVLAATGLLKGCARSEVPKVTDFAERIITSFTEWDFRHHFRLSKRTFQSLTDQLTPHLRPQVMHGKPAITPTKQLLIFLWYLCNEDTCRQIANLFGVSRSTVHNIIKTVSRLVVSQKDRFICWPNEQDRREIARSFAANHGVRNCVGCIDGTHVRLATMLDGDQDYINRKGFPSVNLQLVTDDRLLIRDAFVGWPGCSHDARVFRNSPFYAEMQRNPNFNQDQYIIGDSAYPNCTFLVTPMRNAAQLNAQQQFFNRRISSVRQSVERAIGILKGRFRRLRNIYCHSCEDICYYIMAACVLHNMCILADDDVEDIFEDNPDNHPNNYPHVYNLPGFVRRDALIQELWNARGG